MPIDIKLAASNDWQTIQKLNHQVFLADQEHDADLDTKYPFSQKGINYYKDLASGKYSKCLIAYSNTLPVGYIALSIKDFGYRKSKYVEIENIGVDPEYRSKGIGTQLMHEATKWAKSQGADKLYVVAFWQNQQAINFYKKFNFVEIGLELECKI
jgi:ribosomal protein S18 acetylase RimI-like enzyme